MKWTKPCPDIPDSFPLDTRNSLARIKKPAHRMSRRGLKGRGYESGTTTLSPTSSAMTAPTLVSVGEKLSPHQHVRSLRLLALWTPCGAEYTAAGEDTQTLPVSCAVAATARPRAAPAPAAAVRNRFPPRTARARARAAGSGIGPKYAGCAAARCVRPDRCRPGTVRRVQGVASGVAGAGAVPPSLGALESAAGAAGGAGGASGGVALMEISCSGWWYKISKIASAACSQLTRSS